MSDQIVRMFNDTNETGHQLMQSYQSVWMSRWKRTGCNLWKEAHNGSSNTVRKMKHGCAMAEDNSANKLKVSRSVKRHEEIVTKTFEIVNEGRRMSSESLRKDGMEFQDLKMVSTANCGSGFLSKLGQDTDDMETSRCASGYNSDRVKAGEREYHQYHGHSRPRNPVTVCFRESNTSSFFDPPSMSSHLLSALGGEWFQEMQKFSGFRLLPSHLDTSEKTEVKKSLYDCYSLQKVPKCTHEVETERICTTMDSVLDSPGGSRPRFCQPILSLGITKRTEVNLENDIFRSTRILGDAPCEISNLSPFYGQGKRGLKIQSLSNFTNSDSKGNYVKDSEVTANNESSLQEKDPLTGATSTPSEKVNNMSSTLSQYQCIKVSAH